jgi:hypothetical protein
MLDIEFKKTAGKWIISTIERNMYELKYVQLRKSVEYFLLGFHPYYFRMLGWHWSAVAQSRLGTKFLPLVQA